MSPRAVSILLSLALLSAAAAAPVGKPVATKPPSVRDQFLVDVVKAVDTATLPAFEKQIDDELARTPIDVKSKDLDRPTWLATFREFGRYFGRIEKPSAGQTDTLKWLAQQPRLLPALMMAVTDADDPAQVLAVLDALKKGDADRLDDYAELATAICVVWDNPPAAGAKRPGRSEMPSAKPTTQPAAAKDLATAVARFRYFADPKGNFVANFKTLPWQLAVHAVDTTISDEECRWAQQVYGSRRQLSKIYFEVPYDHSAFAQGARKADALPYTLPNIRKFGGVCLDQAYFAANVGKALGLPSAICVGQSGGQGELHAWIGFLQPAGRAPSPQSAQPAAWNFYEGRYGAMMFWTGSVTDPQTGEVMTDADVSLLSEATRSDTAKRLASAALCKMADRFPDTQLPQVCMNAIDLSPGNRIAWMKLAELGAAKKLTVEQIDLVSQVINRFAVERYPDFAFAVYRRIIIGRSVDEQMTAMKYIAKQFDLRPDLVATVRVAQGDLLRDANRPKEALAAYQDAMLDAQRTGPVLPQAMDRVDQLLRSQNDLKRLTDVYRSVWSRTPTPQPSGYADITPFCVIGRKFAALLKETGNEKEAVAVQQRVAVYDKR